MSDDDLGLGSDNESLADHSDHSDHSDHPAARATDVSVPRHRTAVGTLYQLKVPKFINVDAHPFDPVDFKDTIEYNAQRRAATLADLKLRKNDLIREKLLNQNTVRWKYSNINDEIIKQANTHFIEWDDGSISIKIGAEMFDLKAMPLYDQLVATSHDELEILQANFILEQVANILPVSTSTKTHKQLTDAIKALQEKDKILNTVTESDPLEVQRKADENERKLLKMKRQLELKRRLQEERMEAKDVDEELDDAPAYERFEPRDDYDDEDDFIDDDEDEDDLDEAAERLKRVKDEGRGRYDEGEKEEERKRRRIIESDEE